MRILLLSTAYNGLTQRAHLELQAQGHDVSVELAQMQRDFRDPTYEAARKAFVYKESPAETPAYLQRQPAKVAA